MGKGPTITEYVEIPIRCKITDHEIVEFPPVKTYIVDKLPKGLLLLGLDFIVPNALDFRWGRNGSSLHRLQIGDSQRFIPIRSKITKEIEKPRLVAIYLTEIVVL